MTFPASLEKLNSHWTSLHYFFARVSLYPLFLSRNPLNLLAPPSTRKNNAYACERTEVFQQVGRQYRHVLVDEWQDTNGPQYQLVLQLVRAGVEAQAADEETNRAAETAIIVARQQGSSGGRSGVEGGEGVGDVKIKSAGRRESLTSKPPPSVFVVGDSDQCIYRFRGADHANVARFAEDFTGCQTVFLRENYRSTGNIARAATAVIEKVQQRIKTETVPVQVKGSGGG